MFKTTETISTSGQNPTQGNASKPFYLTFDLGTTRLKLAAFSESGQLLGQVATRNKDYQQGGYQFQSANDWWSDAGRLCHQLLSQASLRAEDLIACSVSGRAGAAIGVDHAKKCCGPTLERQSSPIRATSTDAGHQTPGCIKLMVQP